MTNSSNTPIIGSTPSEIPKKIEAKPKPEDVKILQIDSSPTVTPLGQPVIGIFGLGDDGEVYIWDMVKRVWMDH